jgi:hypothetical protein
LALWGSNLSSILKPSNFSKLLDELRTNYIKDKRNKIPNEYELTRWLQKHLDDDRNEWFKISYCKIFDSGIKKKDKKMDHNYKVIVHFCYPKDYWIEVDV